MKDSDVSEDNEIVKSPVKTKEFRYEDLLYWVNKGKEDREKSKIKFSVEDLERWSNIGRSKSKSNENIFDEIKSPMTKENINDLKCDE